MSSHVNECSTKAGVDPSTSVAAMQPVTGGRRAAPTRRLMAWRSTAYKCGLFLIFPAFVLNCVAFFTPLWVAFRRDSDNSLGLWSSCDGHKNCLKRNALFPVIQGLSCVCLLGCLLTIATAFCENFRRVPENYHSRKLEWLTLATAFAGTMSSLLWWLYILPLSSTTFGVSYMIYAASLLLLYAAGFLTACGNSPRGSRQEALLPQQEMLPRYAGGSAPPPQTFVYNFHVAAAPPPYQPVSAYQVLPGHCPPQAPPPPYALPPMYPSGGGGHPEKPLEPSAPLPPI